MKRIMLVLTVLTILFLSGITCYAKEYSASSEDETDTFEYEKYLPDMVKDIMKNNGGQAVEDVQINDILKVIFTYLKDAVIKHSSLITELLSIIVVVSVASKINDNSTLLLIVKYISILIISGVMLKILNIVYVDVKSILTKNKELMMAVLPSFITILALSGGALSSSTLSASFTAIISFLESVLSELGLTIALLAAVFMIFERISPVFEDFSCVKHLKKYGVTLITFITTVMMTVLAYQNIISAKADSLSVRSVKFAAANFIPIIGGAVGESLRTVSSGMSYLKASVGGAVSLSLFFTVFPILSELFVLKLMLSFVSFFASVCGVQYTSGIITSFVEIVDIFLTIIICATILSFLVICVFSMSALGG